MFEDCTPPTTDEDPDSLWPGNGCICFPPSPSPADPQVSWLELVDPQDNTNTAAAFGYKSAVETSVTNGITVSGWFKAGDTSGFPWNAQAGHPGQQTSHIFTRGEKASWKAGYNFGLGNWNSFRFEVILKGPNDTRYPLLVGYPSNQYPGIDDWHFVVGV